MLYYLTASPERKGADSYILFWFKMMEDIVRNHIIAIDVKDFRKTPKVRGYASGKELLVKKAKVVPVSA